MRSRGYEVSEAGLGYAAIDQVAAAPPDLVLLDIKLPDIEASKSAGTSKQRSHKLRYCKHRPP
jgi:DNA-binding response OmpR family regulator